MTDWGNVKPNMGGDGGRLEPGAYVMCVTSASDDILTSQTILTFDVEEGDFAGFYSERGWEGLKHWAGYGLMPESKSPTWLQERYAGMFTAMQESSGGRWKFDGNEHNAKQFVGCTVGVYLREADYVNKDGELRTNVEIGKFCPAQDVRAGNVKPMKKRELSDAQKAKLNPQGQSQDQSTIYDDDLPFL